MVQSMGTTSGRVSRPPDLHAPGLSRPEQPVSSCSAIDPIARSRGWRFASSGHAPTKHRPRLPPRRIAVCVDLRSFRAARNGCTKEPRGVSPQATRPCSDRKRPCPLPELPESRVDAFEIVGTVSPLFGGTRGRSRRSDRVGACCSSAASLERPRVSIRHE